MRRRRWRNEADSAVSRASAFAGGAAKTSKFGLGLNLPTAFKLQPDTWPFGIMAGAKVYGDFSWKKSTTQGGTTTTGPNVRVTNAVSSTLFSASVGETHSFGIFVPLTSGIRADLCLNGSNLLNLDDFSLQLYIPLR